MNGIEIKNIHHAMLRVLNIFFLKINFNMNKIIDTIKKIQIIMLIQITTSYFLSYLKYIKLPYKMWQPPKPNAQNNRP